MKKIIPILIFIILIIFCNNSFAYSENTSSGNNAIFTYNYTEDITLNDIVNIVFDSGDTSYYTISEIQNSSWVCFYNPSGYYDLTFDIQSIAVSR